MKAPLVQIPEFCADEGNYKDFTVFDGASYGDVRHSHAEIVVERRDVNKE